MTKAVIPFEFDLPSDSPLLSENAGVAQAALARVEQAVAEAMSETIGTDVPTVAIWPMRGTYRKMTTDGEVPADTPPPASPPADEAIVQPSDEQTAAIARIHQSYRTIVAGASGTGRTTTAVLAARAWNASTMSEDGPALIVVADERKRSSIVMLPGGDGTTVYTCADILRINQPGKFLNLFGLVLMDDAGPSEDSDVAKTLDLVLRQADVARVARFVPSGPNDDDATIVLRTIHRQ